MVSRKVWVANLVVSLILAALVLVDAFLFDIPFIYNDSLVPVAPHPLGGGGPHGLDAPGGPALHCGLSGREREDFGREAGLLGPGLSGSHWYSAHLHLRRAGWPGRLRASDRFGQRKTICGIC